jgi:class 3 adenylate cyclase/tetratricopeptide (TPR) repeat protein
VNPFVPDLILQNDARGGTAGAFEAAALFVDISGFTPLTGSLLAHGREGAETLANALRFHFDPLIAAVDDAGGFITGFAGDAFTALFPDAPGVTDAPDAATRALGAAHRMQRYLAAHPEYPTLYGGFPFSIRVGLAWGRVGWGIVRVVHPPAPAWSGGAGVRSPLPPRSFFYFEGPPIDASAAAEHRARAGEVILDASFQRRVPASASVPVAGQAGIFRAVAPASPGDPIDTRPTSWLRAPAEGARFLAPGVAEIPPQGEFRDVVSCFLAFDRVADVPRLIRLLDELAGGYGGTFTGLDFGDKGVNSLIHFGAPVSHENDTERALDFALDLGSKLGDLARVRAGVTRDVRYVGWNGGARRREFACLGRGTNLAARLMMKAAWGEVLCDPKVSADAFAAYDLEPRGDLALRGFEQPVTVHALVSRRAVFEQPRERPKQLVGRVDELDRLLSSLAPIFAGRCAGIVYIDGEAGLGKSFLVETARRRLEARGTPVLWIEARCDQTLQRSLNAFEVALKEHFEQSPALDKGENLARFEATFAGLLDRLPPSEARLRREMTEAKSIYAALLGHRSPGSLYERSNPRERFERTLAAIATWVRAESRLGPVILHVEDAHWADGDTLRAVQVIARMGRPAHDDSPRLKLGVPVAIVCTARYTDDGGPFRILVDAGVPARTLGLAPLSGDEIARIAENACGRPLPEPLRGMLIEGAGGNPFFAEEIFSFWTDVDLPTTEASISSPSVALLPSDVNSLLVARLDRLPSRVKLTVLAAAVLGKEFDLRVLRAMAADDPEVADHVQAAVAQRIFLKQGEVRYVFRNTLLRNAAYEIQARARLARLHLLAAEALEQVYAGDLERHFAALGRHYRRAGLPDKARPYLLAAAREATNRYAHTEAKRHYRSYFKLVAEPTAESMLARYELARDVFEPRGDFTRARDEHARIIEDAQALGDGASEARGLLGLGRVAWAAGELVEAQIHLEEALSVARRAGARWTEAQALAHLSLVHKANGLPDEAVATFERALGLGRAEDRRARAESQPASGGRESATVFGDLVAHDAAARRPGEALDLFEQAMALRSLASDHG